MRIDVVRHRRAVPPARRSRGRAQPCAADGAGVGYLHLVRTPERPHVLILGGLMTEPFMYRRLRRRLLARGANDVDIAPLHLVDWVAGVAGLGPLLLRSGVAVRRAHRARAGGRPLLVVAHSGGGILARLAMAPEPFDGRHAGVADAVGCLGSRWAPRTGSHAPRSPCGTRGSRRRRSSSGSAPARGRSRRRAAQRPQRRPAAAAGRRDGGPPAGPPVAPGGRTDRRVPRGRHRRRGGLRHLPGAAATDVP